MAKDINQGYSQNTTLVLAVVIAIVFGYLGYWYGTVNPGGFETFTEESLGIEDLIRGGSPRDHPGTIYSDVETLEDVYENSRINLSFRTPPGYMIKDRWPAEAHDLYITASSFEYLSMINREHKFPEAEQLEIIESETISQLNSESLPNINSLEDYILAYSADHTDPSGQNQKAIFSTKEAIALGNAEGYKVTLTDEYAKTRHASEIYLIANRDHFYEIIFRDQKLKDKVVSTISFDFN